MILYRRDVRAGTLPWATQERVEGTEAAAEWIFLGLRRTAGISWDLLAASVGQERMAEVEKRVAQLEKGGFLARNDGRLRLRRKGLFVSNAVFSELLAAL